MSDKLDPNNYTVTDLIHDPSFRRMVKGTASTEEVNQWILWMEASDQNRERAKEAASEIAGFGFNIPGKPDVEREWNRLYKETIGRKEQRLNTRNPATRGASLKWIYRIAAVLVLGVCVGYATYMYSNTDQITEVEQITQERTVKAGSGEQKTVKFSDGSKIVLNSNSSITYQVGLLHNQTVKVVLEGEAYFDAESDSSQKQPVFAVHTPDGIIRDIGTEFLVKVEENRSNVVLQEGKVEVNTKNKGPKDQKITMQKGEMLVFDKSSLISQTRVNATLYTSWATGYMEFSGTSIQEFAAFIEQRFEVDVRITNSEVASIALDGAVYFESLSGLVRTVSDVTNVRVYQSKDLQTVYIGNK
ncbi:FecR family protein [Fodinibius salsisoli]|uniref:FecR domain-containing protein n=1 Tax=Fodinibius salsisoli TaxID=2820877 RepID=A0ABT3PJJ0_9BACT|nr:FecR domain-containing protein [Fodinibius salsisoli]